MSVGSESKYLGLVDLIAMFAMIGVAIAVGIYYAFIDRKKSVDHYYYGGRNMSPIAVGMSIAVSYISAITVIGYPAETYLYGTTILWLGIISIIANFIACIYYIPLIHRLRLKTINEYLELRFHSYLRRASSIIGVLNLVVYMAMTTYVPALALNAMTPLSLFSTIALTSLVCTIYTTLGGIKAVVWTNAMVAIAMLIGSLAAMIKTIMIVGGFSEILSFAAKGERMTFWNFDPNPTLRYTFWTFTCGMTFQNCITTCINQAICQRYLSCKSINKARIAAVVSAVPTIILNSIAVISGLAMYAFYKDCDPLKSGKIDKPDQMLAYLVVEIFEDLPGMAGLFVAAAFSGTLSTVSSGLNSLAALLLEDFILARKKKLSEAIHLTISKAIVCIVGVLVMGFAMGISKLEATMVRIGICLGGALSGPLLGVYTLGIFIPWSNTKGAAVGQIVASCFTWWIALGSLLQGSSDQPLPSSIDGCLTNKTIFENMTILPNTNYLNNFSSIASLSTSQITTTTPSYKGGLEDTLYAISFMYFSTVSFTITFVVGLAVSFLTGANDPKDANPRLFVPVIDNKIFPEKIRTFFRFGVPSFIPKEDEPEKEKLEIDSTNSDKKVIAEELDKKSDV